MDGKQYEHKIHYITFCILNNQSQQAINAINALSHQGFTNNQLQLLLSYAYFIKQGPNKALQILKSQHSKGPLIEMARAQYLTFNNQKQKANESINVLISKMELQQKNGQDLIDYLHRNILPEDTSNINMPCFSETLKLIRSKRIKLRPDIGEQDVKMMEQINKITWEYKNKVISNLQAYLLYKKALCKYSSSPTDKQKKGLQLILIVQRYMEYLIIQMKNYQS